MGLLCFRFTVERSPVQQLSSPTIASGLPRSNQLPNLSIMRNPLVAHTKKHQVQPTIKVKVVQAKMKKSDSGKAEFVVLSSTYVELTDVTANVNYLTSAVQNKWGPNHVIVGLLIEDSSGTRGIL